jgi:hypothetical protein
VVEHRLAHRVAGVEDVRRPEVAARVGEAVAVEVARAVVGERAATPALQVPRSTVEIEGAGALVHGEAVGDGVDADGGDALRGEERTEPSASRRLPVYPWP